MIVTWVGVMDEVLPKDSSHEPDSAVGDESNDVVSEVRESIQEQREMEQESWFKDESASHRIT